LSNSVKKISRSIPVNDGGIPKIQKHTDYLERPFSHKAKLPSRQRALLPLRSNSVSRWVGLTPFPVGFRRAHFRDPLGYWDGFVKELSNNDGSTLTEKELKHSTYSLIAGSYDTNLPVLEKMSMNTSRGPSVQDLLECSFQRYEKFGFPDIKSDINKKWLSAVPVNPDAFPGILTSRLIGSDKRNVYSKCLTIARELWDDIVTSRHFKQDFSLWSIGGRPRRQDMSKGKPPRSRLILMPEMSTSFISGIIGTMITQALKLVDKSESECFMGQEVTNGMWKRISEWAKPGQPVLELDWTEYDSTLTHNALVSAFCLLRTCFPKSSKIDKLFIYVMSGTIHKHIVLRQRFIYRVTSGLPSGSPLTSLLGTVTNWVLINYTLMSKGLFGISGKDDFKLAIAGDDTLIAFNNYSYNDDVLEFNHEEAKEISKTFKETVNLDVDPDELNFCIWGDSGDEREAEFAPSLLKTTIWHGLPGRRIKDLVKSMSCPERSINSYLDVHRVVDGLTKLPIYTPKGYMLLRKFSEFIGRMVKLEQGWEDSIATFDVTNDIDSYTTSRSLIRTESAVENALIVPWYEVKLKLRGTRPMIRTSIFDYYYTKLHPT
jgi:hypothetical protein